MNFTLDLLFFTVQQLITALISVPVSLITDILRAIFVSAA